MKREGKTTIADIARKSGYSKTAVSFAFNNPNRISKEAFDTIMKVAKDLSYIPDPMARNFLTGKHYSIGFLLPQVSASSLNNPYTLGVMRGIAKICEEKGYNLTIIPPLHSSIPEAVKSATVDGLITMGHALTEDIHEILKTRGLPIVAIDGAEGKDVSSVYVDDEAAAEMACQKAIDLGHRNFAIIALKDSHYASRSALENSTSRKRMRGYRQALEKNGLEFDKHVKLYSSEATWTDGLQVGKKIFSELGETTCILSMADIIALGVIKSAEEFGLSIPEDCSVIGFDDIKEVSSMYIELTTVRQSADEKGEKAAEALFDIIDNDETEVKSYAIPYGFVERKTLKRIER